MGEKIGEKKIETRKKFHFLQKTCKKLQKNAISDFPKKSRSINDSCHDSDAWGWGTACQSMPPPTDGIQILGGDTQTTQTRHGIGIDNTHDAGPWAPHTAPMGHHDRPQQKRRHTCENWGTTLGIAGLSLTSVDIRIPTFGVQNWAPLGVITPKSNNFQ
jgi:hypothetical protein